MPVPDRLTVEFTEGEFGFTFSEVLDENGTSFKVLSVQRTAAHAGVRIGHNIETIGGVEVSDIKTATGIHSCLLSAPRPCLVVFSNNSNVGQPNEDTLSKTYRTINQLKAELSKLRQAGEFQNVDFETLDNGTDGNLIQRYERKHTKYQCTVHFRQKVTLVIEQAKVDSKNAQASYMGQFSLVRRNNPLSRNRSQRQSAQLNLIKRWDVVIENLNTLLFMVDHLKQKRAPKVCERATICRSTLNSDPCWVYGGADHIVDGLPSIQAFYP
jgi:hypothetical protein